MMAHARNKTPAQVARAKIAAAIKLRGESSFNIWLVRPPFETNDLVLSSDPQVEAFYCLEGEPTFAEISYLPQWYNIEGRRSSPTPPARDLARITSTDGRVLTVRLALGAEQPRGVKVAPLVPVDGVISITLNTLDAHAQRIENWRRIVACIRRGRLHGTVALERRIALALHGDKHSGVGLLHGHFTDVEDALFYAALANLLRRREICADVDTRPWSTNTQVWGPAT